MTELALPTRWNARRLMLEPSCKKSSTDRMLLPMRAWAITLMCELARIAARIERLLPMLMKERTDKALPKRVKLRTLNVDPNVT
jgi:hypothetical protein